MIAGCSAGAMVLCSEQARFRSPPQLPLGFEPGLGLVEGIAVLPHYDRFPETLAAVRVAQASRGTVVLGIDEDTAAIGRDGIMAGPRCGPGDGLARPPAGAPPRRRDLPDLRRHTER